MNITAVGFHRLLERSVDNSSASAGPTETAGRDVRFPFEIRGTFIIEFAGHWIEIITYVLKHLGFYRLFENKLLMVVFTPEKST